MVWVAAPAPVSSGHDASHIDWTCTMHPEVSKEGPGDCPICKMTLVKRTKGSKFIAVRRIVSEGSQSGDWMEIKSGLRGGEMVITSGFLDLVEGAALQIKAAK